MIFSCISYFLHFPSFIRVLTCWRRGAEKMFEIERLGEIDVSLVFHHVSGKWPFPIKTFPDFGSISPPSDFSFLAHNREMGEDPLLCTATTTTTNITTTNNIIITNTTTRKALLCKREQIKRFQGYTEFQMLSLYLESTLLVHGFLKQFANEVVLYGIAWYYMVWCNTGTRSGENWV